MARGDSHGPPGPGLRRLRFEQLEGRQMLDGVPLAAGAAGPSVTGEFVAVNSPMYSVSSESVQILTPGGTFVDSMTAEITTTAADATIRYTLDETLPVESSPQYNGPITITTTQQLRARAFRPGLSPGPVATETYVALGDSYVQNFTSDLPIIVLDDFDGGRPSSEKPAYMAVFDTVGGRSTMTTGMDVESRIGIDVYGADISGRDKASYAIEAWQQEINDGIDVAPLGMPADSDWMLYGPYNFDRALIRDPFMYELSNQVGQYAVRTRFVEVFFNMGGGSLQQDDYRGVYVLMENIKRGPDRVDVANLEPGDSAEPDITGGYILKVGRRAPGDSGFSAGGQGALNYVDPEERNDITTAQGDYIKDYIDDFTDALNSPYYNDPDLGYAAYLDVDSAIDHNILKMLAKDPDAFRLSGYLHKDREGLLQYGPIWDFDRTMGCDADFRAWNPIGWNPNGMDFFGYSWFNRLFEDIDFQQRYTDRWQEWRQGAFSTANMNAIIDSMAAQLQEAQVRNFDRWPGARPKDNSPFPSTFQGEIDWLKEWLQRRTTWVDEQFAPMPGISHGGGVITDPVAVALTVPSNTTVYYTTDGHDPRNSGGGIYAGASVYTPGSQIVV
ncbi:MAG: CotH kinase family protein, partial [Candidatus Nealsonbacteria bacterium]|nr:CotH kinase family protein [Candidatus Nealsonbacteria bacterium]